MVAKLPSKDLLCWDGNAQLNFKQTVKNNRDQGFPQQSSFSAILLKDYQWIFLNK